MINVRILDFDWDDGNITKCQKHGVSVEEIEGFFKQEEILVAPDIKHSEDEERFIAIGRSDEGKPMFVAFTIRNLGSNSLLRPISARYMRAKEVRKYEKKDT